MHIVNAPVAGGAEIYVKDLARSMVAAGHQVLMLFLNAARDVGRDEEFERQFLLELDDAGIEYAFIGHAARSRPYLGARRVQAVERSWDPDLIHAHLYYGALFATWTGVPLIYTHHSIRIRLPWIFRVLDRRV